jgi:hypothetical protein
MLYKAYKNLVFPFILFILNTGCDGGVDFAGLPLERGAVFSDVRIPLARKDHLNPDLIIRIEKIDVSSKKFNYLIISVIPEVTFRGLKIEILGSDNSSSWCDLLNDFSTSNPLFQQVRMERVTLVCDWDTSMQISAEMGLINQSQGVLILRKVHLDMGSGIQEIPEARLHLRGAEKGNLCWKDNLYCHTLSIYCPLKEGKNTIRRLTIF